jgi:hypothetical protein
VQPSIPHIDAMFTITPLPLATIERAAARVQKKVPSRWTAQQPPPVVVRELHEGVQRSVRPEALRLLGAPALTALGHAPQVRAANGAGVVHHEVDRAEVALNAGQRAVDSRAVAHVHGDRRP